VRLAAWLVDSGIGAYQLIVRPFLPPACRFVPSCSDYARQALAAHGLLKGGWLAVRRVIRCHPFHPGGYDPPPSIATPRKDPSQ